MLRFLIKLPPKMENAALITTYSNSVLILFRQILLNKVDYVKIKLRYDYLISNNILQFNNTNNILDYKRIIYLFVHSLKVERVQTTNNNYRTCICLPNYLLIPNSNMSYASFIKFVEYGNLDIPPYNWLHSCWNECKEKLIANIYSQEVKK
jgi:hypothetical protein